MDLGNPCLQNNSTSPSATSSAVMVLRGRASGYLLAGFLIKLKVMEEFGSNLFSLVGQFYLCTSVKYMNVCHVIQMKLNKKFP